VRPEVIDQSSFSDDIVEFIVLLDKHHVRYLLVGGEAVIFYGHARLTGDIDFFYDPHVDNVKRLYAALEEFWQGNVPGVSEFEALAQKGVIIQFGIPPNRIDLINEIDGVSFDDAWPSRTIAELDLGEGKVPLIYIGLTQLVRNKEAAARTKDLEDLKFLGRVLQHSDIDE
jgi:predicted nucleotidyltransferase